MPLISLDSDENIPQSTKFIFSYNFDIIGSNGIGLYETSITNIANDSNTRWFCITTARLHIPLQLSNSPWRNSTPLWWPIHPCDFFLFSELKRTKFFHNRWDEGEITDRVQKMMTKKETTLAYKLRRDWFRRNWKNIEDKMNIFWKN